MECKRKEERKKCSPLEVDRSGNDVSLPWGLCWNGHPWKMAISGKRLVKRKKEKGKRKSWKNCGCYDGDGVGPCVCGWQVAGLVSTMKAGLWEGAEGAIIHRKAEKGGGAALDGSGAKIKGQWSVCRRMELEVVVGGGNTLGGDAGVVGVGCSRVQYNDVVVGVPVHAGNSVG